MLTIRKAFEAPGKVFRIDNKQPVQIILPCSMEL